jgi:hypothetical protein
VTPFALNELVNAAPEVLVMREDGCVMPQRPAHDAEASLSRAILPTPDAIVAHPEQEQGHAGAPPTHFDEAQAEQALWQEFRDHNASINNALSEALRVHGGPSWRIFQVRIFRRIRDLLPYSLCVCAFSDFAFSYVLSAGDRSWRAELGRGTTALLN